MKKNKQLQKLISKLIDISFKDGRMVESQIIKSIKVLKSLPKYQAIQALSEYLKGLKRKEREHTMYIEAAVSLAPIQIQKMKKVIDKKIKITKVLVSVKPEILGGFKLRIGDEVWDESVLGKIQSVKEAISGRSSQSN